ncbi:MAG: histidine kinase [Kiritimatiellia bacterium]|nr:histidine kinase [Kiritimatiellia bacterium]
MSAHTRHLGLRFRLLVTNACVIAVLGVAVVVIARTALSDSLSDELQKNWLIITSHLAEDIADPILTGDKQALRARVFDHEEGIQDAEYVFVLDEKGEVLAHTFARGFPSDLKELPPVGRETCVKTRVSINGKHLLDLAVPVLNGSIGEVHSGFSEETVIEDTSRLVKLVGITVAVALIMQIALSAVLGSLITKPILDLRTLADQVRRIGRGEPSNQIHVRGSNEVSELAAAYNTMREDLRAYQQRLRLLAAQLSSAEEHERRKIAVELHDHIGQTMSAAKIKLGRLRKEADSPKVAANLLELQELVGSAIKAIRSLTFELSPPVLYELGFVPALEWLCDHMFAQYELCVSFEKKEQTVQLDEELRVFLFQVVRELLINVVKHAGVKQAELSVETNETGVRVVLDDKGHGFDAHRQTVLPDRAMGFGLFSIKERLRQFDGSLTIKSCPGTGTHVTVFVPQEPRGMYGRNQR